MRNSNRKRRSFDLPRKIRPTFPEIFTRRSGKLQDEDAKVRTNRGTVDRHPSIATPDQEEATGKQGKQVEKTSQSATQQRKRARGESAQKTKE